MFPLGLPTLASGLDGGPVWDNRRHCQRLWAHTGICPASLAKGPFLQPRSPGRPAGPDPVQPVQRASSQGMVTGKLSSSPVNC